MKQAVQCPQCDNVFATSKEKTQCSKCGKRFPSKYNIVTQNEIPKQDNAKIDHLLQKLDSLKKEMTEIINQIKMEIKK